MENSIDYAISLEWMKQHRDYLNIAAIARKIGTDRATLLRVVKNETNSKGHAVKLPENAITALNSLVTEIARASL